MSLFKSSVAVKQPKTTSSAGLMDNFTPTSLQSRGAIEVVGLRRKESERKWSTELAVPTRDLQLSQVTTYGTMVLTNESKLPLIVPAHIGFFQHGAQNHATSRTLVFQPGEQRTVKDCFCIQAAQGGLLKHSAQRFLMLPLALRGPALAKSHVNGYDRLWGDIDQFTRGHGIARGGHLERFLRPNFHRLQPLRHAFEPTANQTGAAYFVGGQLSGIEIGPSPEYFAEMLPIYSIYCYGPDALLAQRKGQEVENEPVDLVGLLDVEDLASRLRASRDAQMESRNQQVADVLNSKWNSKSDELAGAFRVTTIDREHWAGQTVHYNDQLASVSVFRV